MRRQIIALVAAAVLAMPLVACGTSGETPGTDASSSAESEQGATDELAEFYAGTWRASVETSGNTVYGNVAGKEYMLDLVLEEDGTATVTPLEGHEDLLSGEGTWTASDESAVTVTLDGTAIELTVIDDATIEADPTDFGIDGFDVLTLEYY